MGKVLMFAVVALIFLGIGVGLGYFIAGRTVAQNNNTSQVTQSQNQDQEPAKLNNLYSSQTATLRGEILQRNGRELTVRNVVNQVQGTLNISDRVVITKYAARAASSTPSSDLSLIEINKEAIIGLEMINGKYEAVNIQFTPPAPSLPPLPSLRPVTP